jgi:hypothetical protein
VQRRLQRALLAVAVVAPFVGGAAVRANASPETGAPARSALLANKLNPARHYRLFAADSVWNARLAPDAPLDPRSAVLTGVLAAEIARERTLRIGPWIETTISSTPVYTVPRDQRTVAVGLDGAAPYRASLRRAFRAVPLPPAARPAAGADRHLTVVQPSTDRLWEFFGLRRVAGRWHAAWGGAMRGVSRSPGYFTRAAWPGALRIWGASATSLPLAAGLIRTRELKTGRIDHALAISVPDMRARMAAWPAQRTDGSLHRTDAIPAGAHFRLDPTLDVRALGLPPAAQAIALAAQRYGLIVRDRTLHATGLFAEDPTPSGRDPYPALFDGRAPIDLLAGIPFDRLQLLRMRLRAVS